MKPVNILFSIALLSAAAVTGRAQVTQAWASRYDGPGHSTDEASAIAVNSSGETYVTGWCRTGGFATEDYTTIKYSPSGDTVWVRRLDGTGGGSDFANAIALDMDGFIYVTGQSWGLTSFYDFLTVKYDPAGDTVWTRRYNGPRNGGDIAHGLAVDIEGNIYVTGESEGLIGIHGIFEDYATIKYSPAGEEVWIVRYNGPAGDYDRANALAVDTDGSVYVTGTSDGGSSGSGEPHFDFATVKYDSAGMFQWVRRLNGSGNGDDEAVAIALGLPGNVYVTGTVASTGTDMDIATAGYSPDGDSLWLSFYNDPSDGPDEPSSVAVDGDGNVYVTGRSYGGAADDFDFVTLRYDSSGDTVWVRRFKGPSGPDEATSLALDGDANVYVGGNSNGGITGSDFTTVKYDSGGELQWVMTYSNDGAAGSEESLNGIAVDSDRNVYVAGGSALDFAAVKYAPSPSAVRALQHGIPGDFTLYQNYPNPFNPSTNIIYEVRSRQAFVLSIYDLLGRQVATLVNEVKEPGTYQVTWNAGGAAGGTYFCRMQGGNFTETRKLVLMR